MGLDGELSLLLAILASQSSSRSSTASTFLTLSPQSFLPENLLPPSSSYGFQNLETPLVTHALLLHVLPPESGWTAPRRP